MIETLLMFALVELVLSLSPGPAVLLVMSKSSRGSFTAGAAVACGVIAVNVVYFILSATGVGAALAASPTLFLALKYAGAAYLFWMALTILRDIYLGEIYAGGRESSAALRDAGRQTRGDFRSGFAAGVAVQASSIKNIAIFVSIIPQFIDPAGDVTAQFIALCAISILVELPVLLGYAYLGASMGRAVQNPSMRRLIDGTSAALLIGIGGAVALSPGVT